LVRYGLYHNSYYNHRVMAAGDSQRRQWRFYFLRNGFEIR